VSISYFQAAIPEPFRILGLKLKSFSLGRYLLLKRFDCAFVSDEEVQAGISDLLLGLSVCSMRVDEFLAGLESGDIAGDIAKWGKKVCPLAWLGRIPLFGRWWRKNHAPNLVEKMGLFKSYLEAGSETPKYWNEGGECRSSGAHWSHAVEVVLRSELGWTSEEINEAPLTKALSDYYKFAENQGLIRLMTPDEIAQVEAVEVTHGA